MLAKHWEQLTPRQAFGIARLRQQVFVVEQECAYPDLDDVDIDPATIHWVVEGADEARPRATLRQIDNGDHWVIGRVVTDPDSRGAGLASELMKAVITYIDSTDPRRIWIGAQARLEHWYSGFGFHRVGDNFLEDGIWHVPMARK